MIWRMDSIDVSEKLRRVERPEVYASMPEVNCGYLFE